MARPLRIEFENAFYHVIARGNTRSRIFRDDADRQRFLSYFQDAHEKYKILIHSYCLMNNHYHLLLETPLPNLTRVMQFVNTGYTNYYNRRHNRSGHLFGGRYKALLVEKDAYAQALSIYIHLNPVRAGIVVDPAAYQWSSCRFFISDSVKYPEYLNSEFVLSLFGKEKKKAVKAYLEYMAAIGNKGSFNPLDDAKGEILGSKEFRESWLKNGSAGKAYADRDLPKVRLDSLEQMIIQRIENALEKYEGNEKRNLTIYFLKHYTQMNLREISVKYSDLSISGVNMIIRRIETKRIEDKEYDRKLVEIWKELSLCNV